MESEQTLDRKVIVFRLDKEEFAVSVRQVGSIERILPITRVPGTPSFIKGVTNLRGVVTPIIDLKTRFRNKTTSFTNASRIIIVYLDELMVGIIVDEANDVIDIKEDAIEPKPEVIHSVEVDYISGVAKVDERLLVLLDLEKVLNRDAISELQATVER